MEYRLALLLGKTIPELRATIGGVSEYARWSAYLDLEPPEKLSWTQTAMLALNARRIAGDKRSHLEDFMPQFEDESVRETKKLAKILPGMPDHIAKRFVKAQESKDGDTRRRNR